MTSLRFTCYLLSLCILTLSTGCATTMGSQNTNAVQAPVQTSAPPDSDDEAAREAYVEELMSKPPEELTDREIAYLQMVQEERQVKQQKTIAGVLVTQLIFGLAGVAYIALGQQ